MCQLIADRFIGNCWEVSLLNASTWAAWVASESFVGETFTIS